MDFKQLRQEYAEQTTIKVPFAKSTFVHYSKCPRIMKIDDVEYGDLILTMEVVQVPTKASCSNLVEATSTKDKTKIKTTAIEEDKGEPFECSTNRQFQPATSRKLLKIGGEDDARVKDVA